MKFFHLSDLHFGKQLHGYDLMEEQRKMIRDILEAAGRERPDAIVIAGDIYDRSVPSGSAMTLLEEFFLGIDELSAGGDNRKEAQKKGELSLEKKPIELLVIAGNHDSAPRLRYGSAFLERHHIHIAVFPPEEDAERMQKVTFSDEYGRVNFYLLPYTSAGMLRNLAGEERIKSTDDAIRFLLEREEIDWSERNVLVSHQFYQHGGKEPVQCDSEAPRLYVGGLDSVNTTTVERFDYVALGHIHSPQSLGSPHIRYCGTPYPYSVSEAGQEKSVTVAELGRKGELLVRRIPLEPLRQVRCLRGTLEEIAGKADSSPVDSFLKNQTEEEKSDGEALKTRIPEGDACCHDYVSITLTDEELPESPKDFLENYYDHILEIKVDNLRSRRILEEETADMRELTPFEAFEVFFADTAGREMTEKEKEVLLDILEETGGQCEK